MADSHHPRKKQRKHEVPEHAEANLVLPRSPLNISEVNFDMSPCVFLQTQSHEYPHQPIPDFPDDAVDFVQYHAMVWTAILSAIVSEEASGFGGSRPLLRALLSDPGQKCLQFAVSIGTSGYVHAFGSPTNPLRDSQLEDFQLLLSSPAGVADVVQRDFTLVRHAGSCLHLINTYLTDSYQVKIDFLRNMSIYSTLTVTEAGSLVQLATQNMGPAPLFEPNSPSFMIAPDL